MMSKNQTELILESILKKVDKPGRYTGGEWNQKRKDLQKVRTKVALVFPDLYEIGMSYLGQKILYDLLNSRPSILAERVFAPWVDFEQEIRSQNIPLSSLENRIPLHQFDILGFSLLYELNYSNILTILDLGKIPLFSQERGSACPLIIAGGPAAFNPEPVAEIMDAFLIGDGEEGFLEIIEKFEGLKEKGMDKGLVLRELASIKGVYVPSLYTTYFPQHSRLLAVKPSEGVAARVEKRILSPLGRSPFPEKIVVPNIPAVFDRVVVEVSRGCPHRCRFCQAASIYFPYRVKDPNVVIQNVLNSLSETGYPDASLSSLSVSDYPYFSQTVQVLMDELAKKKVALSLPSLRPGGLSSHLAKNILKVRKTGFTIVPEAGTERLRRVVNKNLSDQEILEAAASAFSEGWRLLKLYFMIGLPQERDEDLEGIVSLVKKVINTGRRILKSAPRINLSVSSFIPKPHTPFQWLGMDEEKSLLEKQGYIKSSLKKYPSVRFKIHAVHSSILEGVFSRGDRRLASPLVRAWGDGARFDSWKDRFNLSISLWENAFFKENVNSQHYLLPLDRGAVLPWDHISTGIKKAHLLEELDSALKGEPSPSCLETNCSQCQGCTVLTQVEKKFSTRINLPLRRDVHFGDKTEDVRLYRVTYSKRDEARFMSHIDLSNLIQRAFRRAGVPVVFSEGFHPKMAFSYVPALPLGMEGKAEVFEFKSRCIFPEDEFISLLNSFLPEGVTFFEIKRVSPEVPSLEKSIQRMTYSVDLKSPEILEAVEAARQQSELQNAESHTLVQRMMSEFLAEGEESESVEGIFLDREKDRLYFDLKHPHRKHFRAQDIVGKIFGISQTQSVFTITRERIVIGNESSQIDIRT